MSILDNGHGNSNYSFGVEKKFFEFTEAKKLK